MKTKTVLRRFPRMEGDDAAVEEVLQEQGIQVTIEPVHATYNQEAQLLRFPGSPTVRVDSKDVEPGAPENGFNMEC